MSAKFLNIQKSQKMHAKKLSKLLSRIDTPSFQRLTNSEHVEEIFQGIKRQIYSEKNEVCVPGCIVICETPEGANIVVDGLHRLCAYRRILIEEKYDFDVFVNIHTVKDEKEAEEIFKIVNNSVPIPKMPSGMNLSIPNKIVQYFREKYPSFFKPSENCRKPHLNENKFTEAVGRVVNFLKKEIPENKVLIETIILILEDKNRELSGYDYSRFHDSGTNKATRLALEKAVEKGGLFFGMYKDYEWLYELFKIRDCEVVEDTKENNEDQKRKTISTSLKSRIWIKYVGNVYQSICPVCKVAVIDARNFHAGHIISHRNGGKTDIENLRPVCMACNLEYGRKNMDNVDFVYS